MVTPDMRRQAKVINFGVLYGMSAFGLAKELGITQKQAQAYIDGYFQRYRGVRAFLDGILEEARRQGYVTTLLNRRRYLPESTAPTRRCASSPSGRPSTRPSREAPPTSSRWPW
jgi:DNA polymerase-1